MDTAAPRKSTTVISYRSIRFKADRVEKLRGDQWILAIRRETVRWLVVKDASASESPVREVFYAFAAGLGAIGVVASALPDVSLERWLGSAALATLSFLLFRNQRNTLTVLEASTENGTGKIDFQERLSRDEIETLNSKLSNKLGWPVRVER